ncbi:sensor histidine kinase [Pedobacter rhodius]|uniref:histidine kinase n=1 Tax=Pedobacter rhodius TaxID=3004098 RepID=A0ABT4L0V9_9SPHI|nr:GAF domain-containing sensor histidine kinase [Pedobacter sp. SJ11]MCZ4224814.1 GAF domain-containing sensor histidine kinase [Pedobacter sp. SJ11]
MNEKIPYPKNESQRLSVLDSYQIIDTQREEDFDGITRLASEICGTPIALITLLDERRQWFKSAIGLDIDGTPREHAFCAHTIVEHSGIMEIPDARADSKFAENPLVKGDPGIVFYAGVSLIGTEGMPLGTICVIDRIVRKLSPRQLDAMQILSKQVIAQMELRKKVRKLSEANLQLRETNEFIQRFATTAAHDLKNPLSSISMSAEMLVRHLQDKEDEKGIKLASTNLSSSKKLTQLVNDMLDYSLRPEILTKNHLQINLKDFLAKTISMISMPENVLIQIPQQDYAFRTSEIALQQIFINLLTNAVRYNDKDVCRIEISCQVGDGQTMFSVSDNGIGIPNDALEKIFSKNVTINESDCFNQSSTGIGLHTVRFLIEKLGGKISVESEISKGSRFSFTIRNTVK